MIARHMEIFKLGFGMWNEWRQQCPHIVPDLSSVVFQNMTCSNYNFTHCDFSGAIFTESYFVNCDFSHSCFYKTTSTKVSFAGSHLEHLFLKDTSFTDCGFERIQIDSKTSGQLALITNICPELKYPVYGYKYVSRRGQDFGIYARIDHILVKLRIPKGVKRSNAGRQLCRAEYIDVLSVHHPEYPIEYGISWFDGRTEYHPGERVYADWWDENRFNELSGGIHFWIGELEVEEIKNANINKDV